MKGFWMKGFWMKETTETTEPTVLNVDGDTIQTPVKNVRELVILELYRSLSDSGKLEALEELTSLVRSEMR